MVNFTEERRKFKRYSYKPDSYPILQCKTIRYKVLNISEQGLKIDVQGIPVRITDSKSGITGNLYLSNGKEIPVSGKLIWVIGNEVGIKLNKPLSKEIIESETKYFQEPE